MATQALKSLLELLSGLGVDVESVIDSDQPTTLLAEIDLHIDQNETPSATKVVELISPYDQFVQLDVLVGDTNLVEFSIDANLDPSQWAGFIEENTGNAVRAQINVDKVRWLADLEADSTAQNALFLFESRCVQWLQQPVQELQTAWADVDQPMNIYVLDVSFSAYGDLLSVIGTTDAKRETAVKDRVAKSTYQRSRRSHTTSWDALGFGDLTPAHFATNHDPEDDSPISSVLNARALTLTLAYLADHVREDNGVITAEFHAGNKRCHVVCEKTTTLRAADVAKLIDLVDWCYQSPHPGHENHVVDEKRPLVQFALCDIVSGTTATETFDLVGHALSDLQSDLAWSWTSYLDGRIDEFTEKVEGLEEALGELVHGTSDQIKELSGRVSTHMLGAVGTIVGTFVAATLKTPFDTFMFTLATTVYGAYMLVFPMIIGSWATQKQQGRLVAHFERLRDHYNSLLSAARVHEIADGRVAASKSDFSKVLIGSIVIYALVGGATITAGQTVQLWKPAPPPKEQTDDSDRYFFFLRS